MIFSKKNLQSIDLANYIDLYIREQIDKIIIVVPTRRKQRNYKREILALRDNKDNKKVYIETFESLTTNIMNDINLDFKHFKIASDAAGASILEQCTSSKKLKFFRYSKRAIPYGTINNILQVIREFKRLGITYTDLENERTNENQREKDKIKDLVLLYQSYNQKLNEYGYKDTYDFYNDFLSYKDLSLKEQFNLKYKTVETIVFSGFDEFSPLEIKVLNKLSEFVNKELYITLDSEKNYQIFSHLESCKENLINNGFNPINDLSNKPNSEFTNHLVNNIFVETDNKYSSAFKQKIAIIEAGSRVKEVENIAKEIKLLIANSINPNDICITFSLISNYSLYIKDIFNKYNIPFNLTDRPYLSSSPIITRLISFLEIPLKNYEYQSILKALYGSFLKPKDFNLSNFVKCAAGGSVVAGYDRWIKNFEELDKESADTDYNVDYKKAKSNLEEINLLLAPFKDNMTCDEFYTKLSKLLFNSALIETLVSYDSEIIEENTIAIKQFVKTVKEILDLLDIEKKDTKHSLDDFVSNIKAGIANTRYNIREKSGYGVLITTPNEIRDIRFDYLFFGGLCDNDLPAKYSNLSIRTEKSNAEKYKNHLFKERYHFYRTLLLFKEKLYLSYPLTDEGRLLTKSNFLIEFLECFDTTKRIDSDYQNILAGEDEVRINYSGADITQLADFDSKLAQEKISAIRLRSESKNSGEPNQFSGKLSKDDSAKIHDTLAGRLISATELELLSTCSFKYMYKRLLYIEPIAPPSEEENTFLFGNLFHEIAYKYFSELKKAGINLRGLSGNERTKSYNLLFKIANNCLMEYPLMSDYNKERLLGINGEQSQSILHLFFENENQRTDNFLPYYFEAAFGRADQDNPQDFFLKQFGIAGIELAGKIDRIEIDRKSKMMRIVDYKTSSTEVNYNKKLQQGLNYQLPIYTLAAVKYVNECEGETYGVANPIIYQIDLKKDKLRMIEVLFEKGPSEYLEENIKKLLSKVEAGQFGYAEEKLQDEVCKYCEYSNICRTKESILN